MDVRELGRRSVIEMKESTHIIIFICRSASSIMGGSPLVLPNKAS